MPLKSATTPSTALDVDALNPSFPPRVAQVSITADILRDAEVGVDTYAQLNQLRNFTPKPMPTLEVSTVQLWLWLPD